MVYPSPPYRKYVECGNQFSSSCDSPLILLLHLTHVQYLHASQLVGREQIGNRITDSVSNSVPSSSCIRLQKQNRTINHGCLSTPYTKETLPTPIHSCSSRAISCWQTRQSVLGRWVDGCQCSWHSLSQSVRHMRRMRVLRSLGPAPADPPTFEADLRSCSVSQGKLQQQTANRHKDRLQTLQK